MTGFTVEPDELTTRSVDADFNIVESTVLLVPVVKRVPVSLGTVIVLSAVGSVTVIVVSYASAVAPSNIMLAPVDVIVPHVKFPEVSVPVVVRFSFPKLIAPELSVMEPAATAQVPPLRVVPLIVVVLIVVLARVVIVAEVCVPPTTPLIVGAVRVITDAVELMPEDRLSPSPTRVYISEKLSFIFDPPDLRVSPVPSLRVVTIPTD